MISTFFTKQQVEDDGRFNVNSGAKAMPNTSTVSPSSWGDDNEKFGSSGAALPPAEPALDANASAIHSG